MAANEIKVELYNGSNWDTVTLSTGATVQTLLDKHGEDKDGGFIPLASRFMVGQNVVDRNHQLSDEDKISFSQPNKVGGNNS